MFTVLLQFSHVLQSDVDFHTGPPCRTMAALDHFVCVDPQTVPGDGDLHMDCVLSPQQMASVPAVKLETHSWFHQTWG